MTSSPGQPTLFPTGETEPPAVHPAETTSELRELAARLPSTVRFGTSSWTFPGWRGIVYADNYTPKALAAPAGLAAYAQHPALRTVSLDKAFYRPPTRDEYADMLAAVPPDFRFVVKAWQQTTRPFADERGRTHGDTTTKDFYNADFFEPDLIRAQVIDPLLEAHEAHAASDPNAYEASKQRHPRAGGDPLLPLRDSTLSSDQSKPEAPASHILLFQMPPTRSQRLLARMLTRIRKSFDVLLPPINDRLNAANLELALEFRDAELFRTPDLLTEYAALLTQSPRPLAHGHASVPNLPRVDEQHDALASAGVPLDGQPALLIRWLLRHNLSYTGAKARHHPFDQLVDPDAGTRAAILKLILDALHIRKQCVVLANNKAEGSAPLTLLRLARDLAASLDNDAPLADS